MISSEVARLAWNELKPGEVKELDWRYVVRHEKIVLLYSSLLPPHSSIDLVAFPHPDHFEEFKKAAAGMQMGGPAMRNPYAIWRELVLAKALELAKHHGGQLVFTGNGVNKEVAVRTKKFLFKMADRWKLKAETNSYGHLILYPE